MTRRILNHRFLMEESELRIEQASQSDIEDERLVAQRILESEKQHRTWESSHYRIMKNVAEPRSEEAQLYILRQTAISLTHRQALFLYLRDNRISGRRRHILFNAFHGQRDYVNAVIAEHGHFLRAASSSMCATHLGDRVWHDIDFAQALVEYDEAYSSYFNVYCDCILSEAEGRESQTRPLLLYLKHEAVNKRVQLLATGGHQGSLPGRYPASRRRSPAIPPAGLRPREAGRSVI